MFFRRPKSLSPKEAADALNRGELQLVDLREPAELAEARVEGATHIPLDQLAARMDQLGRKRPVAFLCRSGGRSAMATRAAANAGLDGANVKGGVTAWSRAGLPLITDSKRGAA